MTWLPEMLLVCGMLFTPPPPGTPSPAGTPSPYGMPAYVTPGNYDDIICPEGTPIGWGTVTPSSYWLLLCRGCLDGLDPIMLGTNTPDYTPTSTYTPEYTPTVTATPLDAGRSELSNTIYLGTNTTLLSVTGGDCKDEEGTSYDPSTNFTISFWKDVTCDFTLLFNYTTYIGTSYAKIEHYLYRYFNGSYDAYYDVDFSGCTSVTYGEGSGVETVTRPAGGKYHYVQCNIPPGAVSHQFTMTVNARYRTGSFSTPMPTATGTPVPGTQTPTETPAFSGSSFCDEVKGTNYEGMYFGFDAFTISSSYCFDLGDFDEAGIYMPPMSICFDLINFGVINAFGLSISLTNVFGGVVGFFIGRRFFG